MHQAIGKRASGAFQLARSGSHGEAPHSERHTDRRPIQRAGIRTRGSPSRLVRSDWHRRSVPRPRGACGNLLNDVIESGGCSSGYGVPLQPIPVQCRDVSRSRAMHSGGKPCAVPPGVPYSAPNEDGQWLLQIQGTRAHAPIDPSSIVLHLKPS